MTITVAGSTTLLELKSKMMFVILMSHTKRMEYGAKFLSGEKRHYLALYLCL